MREHVTVSGPKRFSIGWGTGIALFYGLFAVVMVSAVVASRQHNPGLVQKNYYDLDLNYQARMVQKQNTAALATLPKVRYDGETQSVHITLPDGQTATKGTVKMYRVTNTADDFAIALDNLAGATVPARHLASGRWLLELEWEFEGKSYFFDSSIFIV